MWIRDSGGVQLSGLAQGLSCSYSLMMVGAGIAGSCPGISHAFPCGPCMNSFELPHSLVALGLSGHLQGMLELGTIVAEDQVEGTLSFMTSLGNSHSIISTSLCRLKQSQKPAYFHGEETWIPTLHGMDVKVTLQKAHEGWEIVLQPFLESTICHSGAGKYFLPTVEGEESGYWLNTTSNSHMPLALRMGL